MFSRSRWSLVVVCLLTAGVTPARAELQLPPRSPRATVSQQVGLTTVTVEYSSPAVSGRPIWGAVVPYGRPWRTGDLPAPKITFSRDVMLGDRNVPAGTYALLTIPTAGDWTIILNKNAKLLGERDYKPELDVARIEAPAEPAPFRERFAFVFSEFTDDRTWLDLEWEKLRVSIPIRVHTAEQLVAEIGALDAVWRQYADMARYLLEKGDYPAGLSYVDRSLVLKRDDYNLAIKASLLQAMGRHADPSPTVEKLRPPGRPARPDFLGDPTVQKLPAATGTAEPFTSVLERGGASIEPALPPEAALGERRAPSLGRGPAASRAPEPGEIAPLIKKGKADIQGCYQRSLRKDPTLTHGKITISVTVGISGLVKNVTLDPPGPFRALEPCVRDAISRWVFPLSPTEYGTEFPVVLRGRD